MSTDSNRILDNVIIALEQLKYRWLKEGNDNGVEQCTSMINTLNREKQKES